MRKILPWAVLAFALGAAAGYGLSLARKKLALPQGKQPVIPTPAKAPCGCGGA